MYPQILITALNLPRFLKTTGKWESNPGNDKAVEPGDDITYYVYWAVPEEDADEEGNPIEYYDVIIEDPIHEYLTYKAGSASVPEATEGAIFGTAAAGTINQGTSIQSGVNPYDPDGFNTYLQWSFQAEPGSYGYVSFQVTVNEDAVEVDYVYNEASVKIGNADWYQTSKPQNPTKEGPEKDETAVNDDTNLGEGTGVMPGDTITYEITWTAPDPLGDVTSVTIVDPLDPNVALVSASYGNTTLTMPEQGTPDPAEGDNVTITYTQGNGSGLDVPYAATSEGYVTWEIGNLTAGQEYVVTLTVKVKDTLINPDGSPAAPKVQNQAGVSTDPDNGFKLTQIPENNR